MHRGQQIPTTEGTKVANATGRRPVLQISLFVSIVALALIGLLLGVLTNWVHQRVRQEQASREAIRKLEAAGALVLTKMTPVPLWQRAWLSREMSTYTVVAAVDLGDLDGIGPVAPSDRLWFSDEDVLSLLQVSGLCSVKLRCSRISDDALSTLARLPDLEELSLARTQVSDRGVAALRHHPRLRVIDLTDTNVTDAVLPSLRSIPQLETVSVSRTKISEAGLAQLRSNGYLDARHSSTTASF